MGDMPRCFARICHAARVFFVCGDDVQDDCDNYDHNEHASNHFKEYICLHIYSIARASVVNNDGKQRKPACGTTPHREIHGCLYLVVRMVGLEPTTSPLSVECSNHLSYIRIVHIIALLNIYGKFGGW